MRRSLLSLGLLLPALFAESPVVADEPLNAASIDVFNEAVAAVEKKDWAVCRTKAIGVWLQFKNPNVAGILGICEAELGMHRDAAEHLDFFFAQQKGATASQLEQAKLRFDAVRPKVALLEITLNPSDAFLSYQGKPIGQGKQRLWVNAGDAELSIAREGESKSQTVSVAGGETRALTLELPPGLGTGGAGGAGAGGAGAGAAGGGGAGGAGPSEPAPTWPTVVLGVSGGVFAAAGIGLLIGGVVGRSNVASATEGQRCAADPACTDLEQDLATARTLGTLGVVGISLGAAALAGMGLYLGLTASSSPEPAVGLHLGPGALLLQGTFQ